MVKILTGKYSTEKEKYILNIIKDEYENKKNIFILVPEKFILEIEKHLIREFNLEGLFGLEVVSLSKLVRKLPEEALIKDKILINSTGRKLLIKKIIEKNADNLEIFSDGYKRLGMINEIEKVLLKLKKEMITPEDIKNLKINDKDILTKKLKDIYTIYTNYQNEVTDRYIDEEEKISEFIKNIDCIQEIKNSKFWVYGFNTFTNKELELLSAIEKEVEEINFVISYDEKYEIFCNAKKTINKIKKYFDKIEIEEIDLESNEINKLGIYINLFDEKKINKEVVNIFAAKDIYSEIEYVASQVYKYITQNGYKANEMLIATTDSSSYESLLVNEFDKLGIPYSLDDKFKLWNTNIIKAIMSLCNIYLYGFQTNDVISYLKLTAKIVDMDKIDYLENYVIGNGINGISWEIPFGNDKAESIRKNYIEEIVENKNIFSERNNVGNYLDQLMFLLENIKFENKINLLIKKDRKYEVSLITQTWNKLIEIINQIEFVASEKEMAFDEFIEYIEMVIKDEVVKIKSVDEGIEISNIENPVGLNKKIVFLLGANEGLLPKDIRASKIFNEDDINALMKAGYDLDSSNEYMWNKEVFNLYSLISKAKDKIYFSYALSNLVGRATKESFYIDRIINLTDENIRIDNLVNDNQIFENMIINKNVTKINLIKYINGVKHGKQIDKKMNYVFGKLNKSEMEEIVNGVYHDAGAKNIKALRNNDDISVSITRLEKFKECPFAYFLRYDLKLSDREEYNVGMLEIGNLYHKVMDYIMKDIISGIDVESNIDNVIEEVFLKVLESKEFDVFKGKNSDKYLLEKARKVIKKNIENINKYLSTSNFKIRYSELAFSNKEMKDGFSPVCINIDNESTVFIEGKIDRIDTYIGEDKKAYCNIIDYKTGDKSINISKILKGIDFQLVVYILAVMINAENLELDKIVPSGLFYYKIHDDFIESDCKLEDVESEKSKMHKMNGLVTDELKILKNMDTNITNKYKSIYIPVSVKKDGTLTKSSAYLSKEGFGYLIDASKENIKRIANEIRGGEISIKPIKYDDYEGCKYCEFKSICQIDNVEYDKYNYVELENNQKAIEFIENKAGEK